MSSSVEKIKERLTITEVISSYLKLEKAGASYKAKCPFHNEKTPSFFVSPDRGTYYCFGCGAKGDMFTFVEEFEGMEFKQALTSLAARAGVEIVPEDRGAQDEKKRLYEAVELAVEFFERGLTGNQPARDYLKKRGLTEETISQWRIGFVQNEWRSLYDYLKTKGVSDQEMLATGLIKRNDADGASRYYDVFRGRIMFPIFDTSGRPVAFSGRILVDDEKSPKYLNSPATILFNKSEVLYGFDRAKTAIRRLNYSILVEGQMDLLMSHQAGLANTVASSGTALTELHLAKLMRLSPRVMFAFDSDSAGFNATKKSAELALRLGMEVKVAALPPGDDPASLVAKDANLWKQALKTGKHIIDFYTDSLIARNLDRRVLSREIKTAVLPFVLNVEGKTEQAHFVKSISEKTGLKEEAIWDDVRILEKTLTKQPTDRPPAKIVEQALASRRQGIERRLTGVIWWQEAKKGDQAVIIRKRFEEVVGEVRAKNNEKNFEAEKDKLIFEAEQYYEQGQRFEKDVEELFINLEEEILKDELGKKMAELHRAEAEKEGTKIEEILKACQNITSKLAALRKKT